MTAAASGAAAPAVGNVRGSKLVQLLTGLTASSGTPCGCNSKGSSRCVGILYYKVGLLQRLCASWQ
jgi:hypothetical protein